MRYSVFFVLLAALLAPQGAAAEEVRIGYVDMRKVLTESKTGKKVATELERFVKEKQESLNKEEKSIKAMQDDFEKNKLLLSEQQRKDKQRELQKRVDAYRKTAAEAQRDVQTRESEYAKKAIPEVRAIIRDVAKEEKLTLVFEKNEMPVLYAVEGPDLTDKVIQRFNAKNGK